MSEKMNVVAIIDEKKVEIASVTKPVAKGKKVLINIKACGLCTWEQRAFTRENNMPLPFVGGHEISGVIEEIGDKLDSIQFPIGQKVVARLINVCGKCYYCRNGVENLCVEMNNLEDNEMEIFGTGGLGQYLLVDASQIYIMSHDISFEHATFAEPLACVVNSIDQGKIKFGDDVVIIGGGVMGMMHVILSKLRGAYVIISEPDEARRKLALELGADIAINPLKEDTVQIIKDLTQGRGADVVFNTTPIGAVAQQALEMVGYLGRLVYYSSMHPDNPVEISPNWLHKSQAIITGAVSPSVNSFHQSVQLISKGIVNPEKLISKVYNFNDAQKAFEDAVKPETFRIIVIND
ncbi:zinc-binding dehydrogenase [Alkalibaculum sp. M08DMB]|uniref:Zinc-binding dehydrogenase n=1 Tax=Alkalibaculum sporogenes TaxID=2655001 RepID=A0A6A7K813_9FIRM|nr:zinc-binding dehydrogenase [Alkalibaculum sporogenes]MPW25628.1 zinc-binding dehydrogenase [Alkalibaculum sporogenes]